MSLLYPFLFKIEESFSNWEISCLLTQTHLIKGFALIISIFFSKNYSHDFKSLKNHLLNQDWKTWILTQNLWANSKFVTVIVVIKILFIYLK